MYPTHDALQVFQNSSWSSIMEWNDLLVALTVERDNPLFTLTVETNCSLFTLIIGRNGPSFPSHYKGMIPYLPSHWKVMILIYPHIGKEWSLITLISEWNAPLVSLCSIFKVKVSVQSTLASLAQLGEHLLQSWEVMGSNPGQVQWVARSL